MVIVHSSSLYVISVNLLDRLIEMFCVWWKSTLVEITCVLCCIIANGTDTVIVSVSVLFVNEVWSC